MTETTRVCECPFPMHQEQLEKIEEKAGEMEISSTLVFSVVIEEGLENLSQ